ncbi:MAG: glycosyltransferase family 39 protein [Elusimicrobiota bacterium]
MRRRLGIIRRDAFLSFMGKRNKKKRRVRAEAAPVADAPSAFWRHPELCIFLAALAVRFVHLLYYRGDFWLRTPLLDDNIFVSWAHTIELEGWLARSLGAFHLNPAYPYFLAALGKTVGRGVMLVFSLQHVAGAVAPVFLYRLGLRAFGRKTAVCAAVIGALYGPAIFYESRFLGEFWIYFFNLASLLALSRARDGKLPEAGWALSGLALGFSAVLRPNSLVLLPLVLAWGLWSLRDRRRRILPCALLYLICLWLPLLPFQLRNRAVDPARGWGLTTASGGVNLYLGNNPEADGLNKAPSFIRYGPGHQYQDFKEEAERRAGKALSPEEVSRYWTRQTGKWFVQRPGAAATLMWRKAGFFWNYAEPPDNFFPSIFQRFTKIGMLPLISWGLVAPLGLAGLLWSLRRREARSFWLLHGYVLAYFAVNVLFYILSRYRFPAAAGLILFAAYALVRLYAGVKSRSFAKAAALFLLCLGCVGFSHQRLIGEEDMGVSHYSMAVIYANKGWEEQAVEEYRKSIAADPTFKASYLNLGILEAKRGNVDNAVRALTGALPLERDPARRKLIQENINRLRLSGP